MDGFFGIGIGELVLIAIVALIFLGPERLPGTFREVAKFVRQLRNMSSEFTAQFGDDFKALEDLDPRRMLKEAIDSIDEEEAAKEKAEKAKTSASSATKKPAATKPTAAKSTTPKTTTPKTTTTKPKVSKTATSESVDAKATESEAQESDSTGSDVTGSDVTGSDTNAKDTTASSTPAIDPANSAQANVQADPAKDVVVEEAEAEHQIAPPQLLEETTVLEEATESLQNSSQDEERQPSTSVTTSDSASTPAAENHVNGYASATATTDIADATESGTVESTSATMEQTTPADDPLLDDTPLAERLHAKHETVDQSVSSADDANSAQEKPEITTAETNATDTKLDASSLVKSDSGKPAIAEQETAEQQPVVDTEEKEA